MIARAATAGRDNDAAAPRPPAKHMVWVPGDTSLMGANDFYPEERPAHRVQEV